MPILFPPLRPSARSFTTADYPVSIPEYAPGIVFPRLWGQTPSNALMQLTFTNIPDDDAVAILDSYVASKGGFHPLTMPPEITSGIDLEELALRVSCDSYLLWHFSEAPKVDSGIPGISNVAVSLVATLSKVPFLRQNGANNTNNYTISGGNLNTGPPPV